MVSSLMLYLDRSGVHRARIHLLCAAVRFFLRMRVQLGTAIAKAATARFVTDGADDGLPVRIFCEKRAPSRASPLPDLPLYHAPA